MRMSNKSYNNMNALAAMCFDANAVIDNLAYSLDYHYYNKIAEAVHLHVAHIMPEWADLVTDQMLQLSARPVRLDINGYDKDYEDIKDVFAALLETLTGISNFTKDLIESADMSGDDEVRIFGEDFLMKVSPFIKQAEEWSNAAKVMDPHSLNIHIKDYTHFIEL